MAAFGKIANRVLNLAPNLRPLQRNLHKFHSAKSVPKNYTKYLVFVGGGLTALICTNYLKSERLDAAFRMRKVNYCGKNVGIRIFIQIYFLYII